MESERKRMKININLRRFIPDRKSDQEKTSQKSKVYQINKD